MVSEYRKKLKSTYKSSLNPCFSGGWSRRQLRRVYRPGRSTVLILVLVEDGLGARLASANDKRYVVLILVLVEDGLGATKIGSFKHSLEVLILVLVEDGLGGPQSTL